MDEASAEARGRANTRRDDFQVQTITPQLIEKLAREAPPQDVRPTPDPAGKSVPPPYTVAPYDVLQVTVWDHPELTVPTGEFRSPEENGNPVDADGNVYYPYVGVVPVAGKTLAQIRSILTDRLRAVIDNPQLDVRIAAFRGKRVHVTGEVVAPSTVPITDVPLRVQDAINVARGFTPEADWSEVTITRGGKTFRVDLLALYDRGDLSQNWLLQDGDLVNVGDRNRNRVFILGEVRREQARVMVKRRMTLAEAIGDAEGLRPAEANVAQIYVIRGDFKAPDIFRLDASSADALLLATMFQLHPRDVVFVSTYELTRWNRVLTQIVPTIQTLFNVGVIYDVTRRVGE